MSWIIEMPLKLLTCACREAVEVSDEAIAAGDAPFRVRLHVAFCPPCRRHRRQLALVRRLVASQAREELPKAEVESLIRAFERRFPKPGGGGT
jgi:hypothetical protein